MLTNEHYMGTIVWGKNEEGNFAVRCPNAHPAIIPEDQFLRVGAKLKEDAPKVIHPRKAGNSYMLGELGQCLQCGGGMEFRPAKSGQYVYWICHNRHVYGKEHCDTPAVEVRKIDLLVTTAVLEDILTVENARQMLTSVRKEAGDTHAKASRDLLAIGKGFKEVESRRNRIVLAYETGRMSLDIYVQRMEALDEMERGLNERKAEVAATAGEESLILENEEAFLEHVGQLNDFLRKEDPKRWKPVIKKIFKQVWMEPGYCTLEYRLPLPEGSERAGKTKRRLALEEPVLSLVSFGVPGRIRTRDPLLRRQ